ncbi:MAG: SusD/RagB family nutrient-binding outer membrane lipoprotein [Gemmatimonadota bacterium]|nr:SusD/RagB family nutrient-binding outer membrane lipoprotein [Gemmatimonadota bacterium]
MNRKLSVVGLGAAVALGAIACDNDKLTRINENPNSPTDAPAGPLFTNAVRLATSRWLGALDLRSLSLVAQHLAEVQYPETDQYKRLTAGFTTGTFDGAYAGELKDLEQVSRKGEELAEPGIWAPAEIMKTWVFGYLTDSWGDIPYSEALKGDDEGGSIAPAYDMQEAIYDDFFVVLDGAVSALESAAPDATDLGAADPLYGGNFESWQRFGNSLRARHALRLVNVDPAQASSELQAAFTAAAGVIEDNADNAVLHWPGDGVFNNPWADNFKTRDDHRISDRLMAVLLVTDDPRLPVYAQPTEDGDYVGLPNALDHADASTFINTTSRPGEVFYPGATSYGTFGGDGASFPSYLMTAAEVLFIKAEAAERGLGGLGAALAQGFYEAAIRASMEQWGVTDNAAITAFLANPAVSYAAAGSQVERLKRIAVQKWVALYASGAQAWFEWRRTCQPETLFPGPEAIEDAIPRRLQYSATELSVNSASLNAAVSRQGPDLFSTPVYWDSSPTAAPTYVAGCGER